MPGSPIFAPIPDMLTGIDDLIYLATFFVKMIQEAEMSALSRRSISSPRDDRVISVSSLPAGFTY